jgi:hypothetical protein
MVLRPTDNIRLKYLGTKKAVCFMRRVRCDGDLLDKLTYSRLSNFTYQRYVNGLPEEELEVDGWNIPIAGPSATGDSSICVYEECNIGVASTNWNPEVEYLDFLFEIAYNEIVPEVITAP